MCGRVLVRPTTSNLPLVREAPKASGSRRGETGLDQGYSRHESAANALRSSSILRTFSRPCSTPCNGLVLSALPREYREAQALSVFGDYHQASSRFSTSRSPGGAVAPPPQGGDRWTRKWLFFSTNGGQVPFRELYPVRTGSSAPTTRRYALLRNKFYLCYQSKMTNRQSSRWNESLFLHVNSHEHAYKIGYNPTRPISFITYTRSAQPYVPRSHDSVGP